MSCARQATHYPVKHQPTTNMASPIALMFEDILRREMTALLARVADGEGLNLDYLVSTYLPPDMTPATAPAKSKKKREAQVTVTDESGATTPVKCNAMTAKGKPCSMKPLAGKCVCRIHDKPLKEPGAPKKAKKPEPEPEADDEAGPSTHPPRKTKSKGKGKAKQPEHTHEVDSELHEDCELCQTHGTPLEDTDAEEEFETVKSPPRSLKDRLKALQADTYNDEEEED